MLGFAQKTRRPTTREPKNQVYNPVRPASTRRRGSGRRRRSWRTSRPASEVQRSLRRGPARARREEERPGSLRGAPHRGGREALLSDALHARHVLCVKKGVSGRTSGQRVPPSPQREGKLGHAARTVKTQTATAAGQHYGVRLRGWLISTCRPRGD